MTFKTFVVGAAAAIAFTGAAANATTLNFTAVYGPGPSGAGIATGAVDLSNVETNGYYAIEGVTGEVNGSDITGLSPYAAADNVVYASSPYLDLGGVSVATASGTDYNFYYYNGGYDVLSSTVDAVGYPQNGSPIVYGSISAAPEPATWGLMILGIGGIGLAFRQAKRNHGFRFKDAYAA